MKNRFLIWAILLFILLMIPYFQNFAFPSQIQFFFGWPKLFTRLYFPMLLLGILEWALILLSIQKFIDSTKQKKPDKFDLS